MKLKNPLRIVEASDGMSFRIEDAEGNTVADDGSAYGEYAPKMTKEFARLIAAAPELLDGLRQAAEAFDSIEGAHSTDRLICEEAVKAIEALIAKATGEQQ